MMAAIHNISATPAARLSGGSGAPAALKTRFCTCHSPLGDRGPQHFRAGPCLPSH